MFDIIYIIALGEKKHHDNFQLKPSFYIRYIIMYVVQTHCRPDPLEVKLCLNDLKI